MEASSTIQDSKWYGTNQLVTRLLLLFCFLQLRSVHNTYTPSGLLREREVPTDPLGPHTALDVILQERFTLLELRTGISAFTIRSPFSTLSLSRFIHLLSTSLLLILGTCREVLDCKRPISSFKVVNKVSSPALLLSYKPYHRPPSVTDLLCDRGVVAQRSASNPFSPLVSLDLN